MRSMTDIVFAVAFILVIGVLGAMPELILNTVAL
jgi:hypothetical protein